MKKLPRLDMWLGPLSLVVSVGNSTAIGSLISVLPHITLQGSDVRHIQRSGEQGPHREQTRQPEEEDQSGTVKVTCSKSAFIRGELKCIGTENTRSRKYKD